ISRIISVARSGWSMATGPSISPTLVSEDPTLLSIRVWSLTSSIGSISGKNPLPPSTRGAELPYPAIDVFDQYDTLDHTIRKVSQAPGNSVRCKPPVLASRGTWSGQTDPEPHRHTNKSECRA